MTKRKPCVYCGAPCGRAGGLWHRLEAGQGGCLIWTGKILKGYGTFGGGMVHRMVYEYLVGPIPEGLQLDHLCRVKLCANPYHLEPVTRPPRVIGAVAHVGDAPRASTSPARN